MRERDCAMDSCTKASMDGTLRSREGGGGGGGGSGKPGTDDARTRSERESVLGRRHHEVRDACTFMRKLGPLPLRWLCALGVGTGHLVFPACVALLERVVRVRVAHTDDDDFWCGCVHCPLWGCMWLVCVSCLPTPPPPLLPLWVQMRSWKFQASKFFGTYEKTNGMLDNKLEYLIQRVLSTWRRRE